MYVIDLAAGMPRSPSHFLLAGFQSPLWIAPQSRTPQLESSSTHVLVYTRRLWQQRRRLWQRFAAIDNSLSAAARPNSCRRRHAAYAARFSARMHGLAATSQGARARVHTVRPANRHPRPSRRPQQRPPLQEGVRTAPHLRPRRHHGLPRHELSKRAPGQGRVPTVSRWGVRPRACALAAR
jgi:hypothetical protein